MKKRFRYINLILMIAVVSFVLAGWFVTGKETDEITAVSSVKIISSTDEIDNGEAGTEYIFDTDKLPDKNNCISFLTIHQNVYVYSDKELIYADEKIDSIYGHSTGSVMHFIEVNDEMEEIVIRIEPVYSGIDHKDIEFFYGTSGGIIQKIIRGSLWEMLIAIVIMSVGTSLILYYFLLNGGENGAREALYIGLFAVFLGMWAFGETEGAGILLSNRVMASYLAFTLLSVTPILFVMFVSEFLKIRDKKFRNVIVTIMYTAFLGTQFMQFLDIRDLKQNAIVIQSMIIFCAIYFIYAIVMCMRHGKYKVRAYINLVGAALLIFAMFFDLKSYYIKSEEGNSLSTLAFMIYVILLSVETAKSSKSQIEQERKLELYRQMATKDLLTNCNNRNAYLKYIEQLKDAEGYTVVICDLNNLKECNDTLGHAAGDRYIVNASEIIRECFEKYGDVYRIGGDEFAVLLKNRDNRYVEKIVQNMNKILNQRKTFEDASNGIACGFAEFDSKLDKSIEDTIKRADAKMYDDKNKIKKKR